LSKPAKRRRAPVGGRWTREEDEVLRDLVNTHGPRNWKGIADLHGGSRFYFLLWGILIHP